MKILSIQHNSFSKTQNNGKTGEDLYSMIPKEDRFQLFFTPLGDEYDDLQFAQSSFLISDRDVLRKLFFKSNKCGGIVYSTGTSKISNSGGSSNHWYKNRLFRDLLWATGVWKSSQLIDWCMRIHPDIIIIGGSSQTFPFRIALYISNKLNIPTAIYCGDDYIAYYKPVSLWDKIHKVRLKIIYKKFCCRSSLCFAISESMAGTFSKILNKNFIAIPRPVDIPEPSDVPQHDVPVISYFGGLGLNRWKMIARLGKLVENAKIYVYSMSNLDDTMKETFDQSGVKYMGGVRGDDLENAMKNSDILLHVESDDMVTSSFTRLAVSTKIPEYLAAKRFVLGYGPSYLASMKVISDNNVGVVLDSKDSEDSLRNKLNNIISDSDLRRQYADVAYCFAKNNYSKEIVATKLKELLEKACKGNN